MTVRRWPLITITLIAINVIAFFLTIGPLSHESTELSQLRIRICMMAATHPDLELPPLTQKMVDDIRTHHPELWRDAQSPSRRLTDLWDNEVRAAGNNAELQEEMNKLAAQFEQLEQSSVLTRFAFIPASPTWYSYLTNTFLHGGIMHILWNMWFLWLAGIILEDVWGRSLYTVVYLLGGVFAWEPREQWRH